VHPVFRVLGGAAALVHAQLAGEPVRTTDLPVLTGLSTTTVSGALAELAAHGIAERGPEGWRRAPVGLDDVAARLGVPEILQALPARAPGVARPADARSLSGCCGPGRGCAVARAPGRGRRRRLPGPGAGARAAIRR
jgi:hypothetical protein